MSHESFFCCWIKTLKEFNFGCILKWWDWTYKTCPNVMGGHVS